MTKKTKKVGGTKVGNALRSVVSSIKRVGNSSQTSTALQGKYISGSLQQAQTNVNTNVQKDLNTYKTQTQNAQKQNILRGGLTGIVTTMAGQGNKVQNALNNVRGSINNRTSNISDTSIQTDGVLDPNITGFSNTRTGGMDGINTTNNITNGTKNPITNVVTVNTLGTDNTKADFSGTKESDYVTDASKYAIDPVGMETDLQKQQKENEDLQTKALKNLLDTPDNAQLEEDLNERFETERKQQIRNELSGKLNAIVNNGEALKLGLVGQGRGIPEAIIGGQQAEIARQTAIQALPIQAQLSAAQDDLDSAEDNVNKLFKIYSEDATNRYNASNKMYEVLMGIGDKKEQRLFEEKKIESDRLWQEQQALVKYGRDQANMAFANGQASLGARIMALNPSSPTYQEDLAELSIKLKDPVQELDRKIKQAQLDKLNTGDVEAPTTKEIDGKTMQWDGSKWIKPTTEGGDTADKASQFNEANKIEILDTLMKNKGGVGLATSAGSLRGAPIPFFLKNKINDWRAGIISIASKLTMDNLVSLKGEGATFGALSDSERVAIGQAASSIVSSAILDKNGNPSGKFKMSEKKVLDELKIIQDGYKLNFERKYGVPYEEYLKQINDPDYATNEYLDTITPVLQINPYLEAGYNLEN